MSRRSKRLRKALLGAAALYGLNKMMTPAVGKETVGAKQKANQISKVGKTPTTYKAKSDSIKLGSGVTGEPTLSIGVDKNAGPIERKNLADKYRPMVEDSKKKFMERKKKGNLSPTMPKSKSQIQDNDPLDPFSAFGLSAKKGTMVKARGGGMARMKPTKLY